MADTITKAEFDAFKANTVEIALAAAKAHSLCEVVQRTLCKAGFADQLAPVYQVHVKYGPSGRYEDAAANFDDVEKARKEAVRVRKQGIESAKRNAKYDLEYRHREFTLNISHISVDEAKAKAEAAVKEYQLKKRQAAGQDTEWPKVKIVKKVWQDNGRQKSEHVEYVK